jgi:hypothetical protein
MMAHRAAPNDRPRIVRLITRLALGGPARQALLLTRELAPQYDTTLGAGVLAPGERELPARMGPGAGSFARG